MILSTDAGKIVSMNSSSATTLKLPAASPGANFNVYVENIGTGICTLNPNGLNLDGSASTVTLPQNQGMYISSDGTNYFSERGLAAPPIPTTLALVTGSLATGASENDTPAFPKNATLWRVTASQACRIELYATAAAQTADQAGPRPISVPPTPGTQNGVLLDLSLDFLNYTSPWLMSPPALLVNGDSPQNSQLYSTITNYGTTGAITVTFYYFKKGTNVHLYDNSVPRQLDIGALPWLGGIVYRDFVRSRTTGFRFASGHVYCAMGCVSSYRRSSTAYRCRSAERYGFRDSRGEPENTGTRSELYGRVRERHNIQQGSGCHLYGEQRAVGVHVHQRYSDSWSSPHVVLVAQLYIELNVLDAVLHGSLEDGERLAQYGLY